MRSDSLLSLAAAPPAPHERLSTSILEIGSLVNRLRVTSSSGSIYTAVAKSVCDELGSDETAWNSPEGDCHVSLAMTVKGECNKPW
jgi:hypothetical protein